MERGCVTLILKKDALPNRWVLTSLNNNVVAGPLYFISKDAAESWAYAFITSWNAVTLVVDENESQTSCEPRSNER